MPLALFLAIGALAAGGPAASAGRIDYDPLRVDDGQPQQVDLIAGDDARSREIPIRVYLPPDTTPAPVVLFSHGLGGTREGCRYLGVHWAKRGYIAVFLQHPGSDDAVWKNVPRAQRMAAMERAASGENLQLRIRDVPVVLDQLETWNGQEGHALAGRLDMRHIGMSGHSFGAVTTQAVGGQWAGRAGSATEPRFRAAIAMSPSSPRAGDPKRAFENVKIPWMLMTGTNDTSPIGDVDVESRLAVYPALPPGGKYELVLDKAEHSAFSDRALPGEGHGRNPNHHRAILALTTAFWDAYLRDDAAARAWVDGDGPRSVLEEADRWQRK